MAKNGLPAVFVQWVTECFPQALYHPEFGYRAVMDDDRRIAGRYADLDSTQHKSLAANSPRADCPSPMDSVKNIPPRFTIWGD